MDKRRVILALRDAKKGHMRWAMLAQALIEGVPIEQKFVPTEPDTCDFGRWYHGEGVVLMGFAEYGNLNATHKGVHRVYQEIFELLYGRGHKNWATRVLAPNARNHRNLEKARALLPELRRTSGELIDRLNLLERRVLTLNAEELDSLVSGREIPPPRANTAKERREEACRLAPMIGRVMEAQAVG